MITKTDDEFTFDEQEKISAEFERISDLHYLDNAGSNLYSEIQVKGICNDLNRNLYCNPHTSKITEDHVNQVRDRVLQFFNTNSSEYSLIFTHGATDSLQTVAQCFDFQNNGHFVYLKNVHNSVIGMRSIVKTPNVTVYDVDPFLQMVSDNEEKDIPLHAISNSLFVYPAQCNFNGYKYPLEAIEKFHNVTTLPAEIQKKSKTWFVCLDAANFVSSNFLDLTKYKPDFVALSFYKIFGYPTGLGGLLVSKRGERVLNKTYHGGGTIDIALSGMNFHKLKDNIHEKFENGTIPFLSIISLLEGFKTIERLVPPTLEFNSMERITRHCFKLGKYLFNELKELRHKNGRKAIVFYNQTSYEVQKLQGGGIVNFNVVRSNGDFVGFTEIESVAELHSIYLRVGCFCNPGACQTNLTFKNEQVMSFFSNGRICGDENDINQGHPMGFVRISLGYYNTKRNIDAFLNMIRSCYLGNVSIQLQQMTNAFSNRHSYLTHICIYPVKNCAPVIVNSEWEITENGLKYNNEWVIVNEFGIEITQKSLKEIAQIRPMINKRTNMLRLIYPNVDPIHICMKEVNVPEYQFKKMGLGKSSPKFNGSDCGDDVSKWLEKALKVPGLRLLRENKRNARDSDIIINSFTDKKLDLNNKNMTLVNVRSVQNFLEKLSDSSVDTLLQDIVWSFRPNFIIHSEAFRVDKDWNQLQVGNLKMRVSGQVIKAETLDVGQFTGEPVPDSLLKLWREYEAKMRFGIHVQTLNVATISTKDTLMFN